jgi:hypothetical protein
MIALAANWMETRVVESITDAPIKGGELLWGSELAIPIPANTTGVLLNVSRADQKSEVVSGTDMQGWVLAELRPELSTLILRAADPSSAIK